MATENSDSTKHTPWRKFRLPTPLWDAYGSVCARILSRERSEDLVEHVRALVAEHGNADELAKLKLAEQELEERRSRKGGRPRKTPPAE